MPYTETGSHIFPGGSYANGGAMRIAAMGIAFHNATPAELRAAVAEAVRATHTHPGTFFKWIHVCRLGDMCVGVLSYTVLCFARANHAHVVALVCVRQQRL